MRVASRQRRSNCALLSGVLNCLRTAEGGFVTIEGLIQYGYRDPDLEPDWANANCRLAVFWLRRRGFPIIGQYGRGYRFAPTYQEMPCPIS